MSTALGDRPMRRNATLAGSIALLAINFAFLLRSSFPLITYSEAKRGGETWVLTIHEAGYARLAIAVVALLILFVPFRRRQFWAWLALLAVVALYLLPASYVAPTLVSYSRLRELVRLRQTSSVARVLLTNLALVVSALLGLALSLPLMLGHRAPRPRLGGKPATEDRQ
jgi:hypothetical protein